MSELDQYDNSEIAYVVELLAAMCTIEEVKNKFLEFSSPAKTISPKTIKVISLKYSKQIRERNEAYLKNIKGNPLAHQRIRLDILNRIVEDSLKQRPSHSVKIGENDYEVVTKADNPTAIRAIHLAMTDMAKREELDLEKEKQRVAPQEESDYEVDDGIA